MQKPSYNKIFIDSELKEKAKELYLKRRIAFAKQFKFPIIIIGAKIYSCKYDWDPFEPDFIYQEPSILFFTGINQTGIAILLNATEKEYEEILFLPKKDLKKELWEGPYFCIGTETENQKIKDLTGFNELQVIKNLNPLLFKKAKSCLKIGTIWHENINNKKKKITKDANYTFKLTVQNYFKKRNVKIKIINLMEQVFSVRSVIDKTDLELMKKAYQLLTAAFLELLKILPDLESESEAAHYLSYQLQKKHPFGLSFPIIAASGTNATILHYNKNADPIYKNELLLLDFGIRYHNMNIDVSRTVPVSGKFNPLQKILYQIVLDTQKLIEKTAKAGITIEYLNELCWNFINKELKHRILDKGGTVKLKYEGLFPHFVSHLIGYQTHEGDPWRLYRKEPLKAGNIISNEPGVYGEFCLTINGQFFQETLGIRIEDNLLILDDTCENLTHACPKEINEIENLLSLAS